MENRRDKNNAHGASASERASGQDAIVASRERFCDYLIAAREQSGRTLDAIAAITRIPIRSLERLESGEFERLPADVFVRGFLRSYARCVGLSEDETIRRYSECGMTPAPVASPMADELLDSLATLDSSPPPSYRVRRASTRSETGSTRMAAATPATGTPVAATPATGTPVVIQAEGTNRVAHEEDSPATQSAAKPAQTVEPARQVKEPLPVEAQPAAETQAKAEAQPAAETQAVAAAAQESLPADAGRASVPARAAAPLSRNARKRKRKNRKRKRQAGSPKNVTVRERRTVAQDDVPQAEASTAIETHEPEASGAIKANEPEASGDAKANEPEASGDAKANEPETSVAASDPGANEVVVAARPVELASASPAGESLSALSEGPASPASEPAASGSAIVEHVPAGDSARRRMPRPVLVIDDADPEQAERIREEREAAKEREDATWRTFLPPSLLDSEEGSRRGALTLAVIILVIVATLTMSYLMRRPNDSGDGVTRAPDQAIEQVAERVTEHLRGTEHLS